VFLQAAMEAYDRSQLISDRSRLLEDKSHLYSDRAKILEVLLTCSCR
jgi:hypothetical protein